MTTYEEAGIHNDAKQSASRLLYEATKATWANRKGTFGEVVVPFDRFSGIRGIDISGLPQGTMMTGGADGIGTKVYLAEMLDDHSTMAYNLVAMSADDRVVEGAEPVSFFSILDTNSLKGPNKQEYLDQVRQMAAGLVDAARQANVVVLGGETAELKERVGGFGPFNYNWGGVTIAFARRDRLLTGERVVPGDDIVGFRENGFGSNGLSLARRVFEAHYGPEWVHASFGAGAALGPAAMAPTTIYTRTAVELFGGYSAEPKVEVHKIAHITGEGMPGKIGRAIEASGYGVVIDNPFAPPAVMMHCQQVGDVKDKDAYDTFHMGQRMAIILPASESKETIRIAKSHGIDARVIGHVTKEPGIHILNRGFFSKGEMLDF